MRRVVRTAAEASRRDDRSDIAADFRDVVVRSRALAKTIVVAPDQKCEAEAADQGDEMRGIDAGVAQRHRRKMLA